MLVYSHVDVRANQRRDLDAIAKLCRLANVTVLEELSGVFRLALHNLNTIGKNKSAVTARPLALERQHVVEEATAPAIAG